VRRVVTIAPSLTQTVVSLGLYQLMWFWPLVLILPAIVAYTVSGAGSYIFLMAVMGELFAVSPPGILTLAVALPWLANWAVGHYARNLTVDLTLRFLGLVGGVVVAQVMVLMAPTIWSQASLGVLPWWIYPVILWVTGLVFIISVMAHYNRTW